MSPRPTAIAKNIVFGALLAGATIPLVVVNGFGHPFVTPRELLLRLAVAVALPAAAVAYGIKTKRPKFSVIGWSAVGIAAAATLSTVFSVDPWNSFWGFPERLLGLVTIASILVFGLSLASEFRNPKRRAVFLWVWGGVWAIVSLIAIYERVFVGLWIQFHGAHGRVISTIGNPIFLASGLIVAFGTALVASLMLKRTVLRDCLIGGLLLLGGTTILFTETRGAEIGVAVGTVVALALMAFWSRRKSAIVATAVLLALMAAGVTGLYLAKDTQFVKSTVFLNRAALTFRGGDSSQVQRFQLWSIAVRAIEAKPVFGWGLENFDSALDRLYDPNFTRYGVANSYSDRAHDAYLDVAAVAGVVGLAAFLAFLIALAVTVIRLRRAGAMGVLPAAVALGALVAYAIQDVFAFDTVVSYLGLAVAAAALSSLTVGGPTERAGSGTVPLTLVLPLISAISIGLVFGGIVPLARGSFAVHDSAVAVTTLEMSEAAKRITGFFDPYRAAEEHRIANDIFKRTGDVGAGEWESAYRDLLAQAEDLVRDAVSSRPEQFAYRFTLGNLKLVAAMHGTGSYDDAIEDFETARKLAPKRQIVDYQLGNMGLIKKDYPAAIAIFRRAVDLAPDVPESHWHLGRGLAAAGDKTGAAAELKRSILGRFVGDGTAQEYAIAIDVFIETGDIDMVRSVYYAWSQSNVATADVFAGLAAANAELGYKNKALAAVKRGLELDPTLKSEVPAFLAKYGYTEQELVEVDVNVLNQD